MAFSNTPESSDALDCETDQGLREKDDEENTDCPVCGHSLIPWGKYKLRCECCDHYELLEINHD